MECITKLAFAEPKSEVITKLASSVFLVNSVVPTKLNFPNFWISIGNVFPNTLGNKRIKLS